MIYPKKKGHSPDPLEGPKIVSIHNKVTGGTGGSTWSHYIETSSLAPKKTMSVPKPVVSGIFKAEKYIYYDSGKCCASQPSSESTMKEEIFQLLSVSMVLSEK